MAAYTPVLAGANAVRSRHQQTPVVAERSRCDVFSDAVDTYCGAFDTFPGSAVGDEPLHASMNLN